MPKEYIVESFSIDLKHNPVLTLDCKCGITARTSCSEYNCPLCNTPPLIYDGKVHRYHFNKHYYQEIIEEVEREARKRVA